MIAPRRESQCCARSHFTGGFCISGAQRMLLKAQRTAHSDRQGTPPDQYIDDHDALRKAKSRVKLSHHPENGMYRR